MKLTSAGRVLKAVKAQFEPGTFWQSEVIGTSGMPGVKGARAVVFTFGTVGPVAWIRITHMDPPPIHEGWLYRDKARWVLSISLVCRSEPDSKHERLRDVVWEMKVRIARAWLQGSGGNGGQR